MTELQSAIASAIGVLSVQGNAPKDEGDNRVVAQAWAVTLAEFQPETVKRAAMVWMKRSEFFPKPKNMFDLCRELEPPRRIVCTAHDCLPLPKSVPLEERADKDDILACRSRIDKLFGQKEMPKAEDTERNLRQMRRQLKDQGVDA